MAIKRSSIIISVVILASTLLLGIVAFYRGWAKGRLAFDVAELKTMNAVVPIAVIGSGPGGLSTAFYAAREQYHTVLFQGPKPGGQLMDTKYVENWPGIEREFGHDIIKVIEGQARAVGAHIVPETVIKTDFSRWPYKLTTQEGTTVNALTVIIATGGRPRKLGVSGEEEFYGKGVATCTLCDAPFTKDQDVVIVGGGLSSVEFALNLVPYARSILLLVRKQELDVSDRTKKRMAPYAAKIKIRYNTAIQKILGSAVGVTGVDAVDTKTNKVEHIPTSWVFLSIGQMPNNGPFVDQVALNAAGHIMLVGKTQQTSVPGVFAAGRVSDARYNTGIASSGDGLKAALDAVRFLENIGFEEAQEQDIAQQLFYPAAT